MSLLSSLFPVRRLTDPFTSPRKSPKLLSTPSSATLARFSLPPSASGSSSSVSSRSSSTTSASLFWRSPTGTSRTPRPRLYPSRLLPASLRSKVSKRQIAVLLCLFLALILWFIPPPRRWSKREIHLTLSPQALGMGNPYQILRPTSHAAAKENGHGASPLLQGGRFFRTQPKIDPVKWLEQNGKNRWAEAGPGKSENLWNSIPSLGHKNRKPRAALISLVRNSELEGIMQSMRQLEHSWNRKYRYPWVFFNDEEFSEEFKAATRNLTSAATYYEVVPPEHWSLPSWIDESRFMNSLEYLGAIGVGKGWMISYRHMCRWNSGFFYKHPRLRDFDWYWRVEPDVHFFCDIDYDVFRFMRDNDLKYGFNMNILDDARSFPSLWSRTRSFIDAHPELVHPDADLDWLLDPHSGGGGDYNNCQFFSNFEIGSLDFFRSDSNEAYFDWLDRGGGFFYERFGDAPIHTLSVAMFLPKHSQWWFRDIGYQHDINRHCPPASADRCSCEATGLDEGFYKLVPLESGQRKPDDTCIRLWMGGHWLAKREGWSAEEERRWGGDGYGGYVSWGVEGE